MSCYITSVFHTISILGVPVHAVTAQQAISELKRWCNERPSEPALVFTPNPEIVMYAQRHPDYLATLKQGALNLPDGAGLVWLNKQLTERVTGSDTMLAMLEYANAQHLQVGIVYNPDGLSTPEMITHAVNSSYPNINLILTTYAFTKVPDMVFVATGFPQQEHYAITHRAELRGTAFVMAVGGSVDYLTQAQRRAPLPFQRLRLEWLWRLWQQPRRLKRIITATILFPLTYWLK